MAKFTNDQVMDAALDNIINNADQMVVCAGQPANYADATTDLGTGSGNALGETAITSGDFTKADGDTSGRKLTVAEQTGIDVDVSGTADHVALVDDTNSVLLHVTTITSQAVSAGGTMTVQAYSEEIEDPS